MPKLKQSLRCRAWNGDSPSMNGWLVQDLTIADISCFPYTALAGEGQVDLSWNACIPE